jgi:hypothetical protein
VTSRPSLYVRTFNSQTMYNLGCNPGNHDRNAGNINSEVILDFGGQAYDGNGTVMTPGNNVEIPWATVMDEAEQFGKAYYFCTGSDYTSVLKLGIGTNNSAYHVDSAGGATFAGVVNSIKTWMYNYGFTSQVSVGGANDIESGYAMYPPTKAWVDGYAAAGGPYYLNFGSANGCPPYGQCTNGWSQDAIWYVSYGAAPAYATPEIYSQAMADEWGSIYAHRSMQFEGPMDENSGDFNAGQAWSTLWYATGGQTMTYSIEIHIAS